MEIVSPRNLSAVVVCSGAAALAVEVSASRLLAPFFGSSTIVWANIIGLILLYLSAGYWIGGRYADRHPWPRRLGVLLLIAAVAVAALPFAGHALLQATVSVLTSVSAGSVVASFVGTLLLFAIPVTLLGMVSPFALRLALREVESAGAVAGRLYALSTIGSLMGTFIPALISIPLIGTQRTMIAAAVLCAIAGALLLSRRWVAAPLAMAVLLAVPPGITKEQPGLIAEEESQYQYIDVAQTPTGERRLELDEGVTTHSVWRAGTVLTGGEWDMFLAVPSHLDHEVRSILIIGDAGGTTARALGHFYPEASIDGVEIDPAVTAVGAQYFGLRDNPRLTVHDADGRPFLQSATQQWDMIIVDAYHQPYIPFHLATQEFFEICRDHLASGGALALNVETIPGDPALQKALETTVRSVMPDAWVWPALRFNEMLIAVNSPAPGEQPQQRRPMDGQIAVLGRLMDQQLQPASSGGEILTDDRAPVEWLTDRSLLTYIASGGRLDEPLLPTYPEP